MMNYLIVDDEPIAHKIIMEYASNLDGWYLQKSCYNAFQAVECLNAYQVDLVFLDINMPKMSGFDFLKTLRQPPQVIVTTAYEEFALEGYDLNVVDYLLKPFSLQRFMKAVSKVDIPKSPAGTSKEQPKSIFLKDGTKLHQVPIQDILFIKAMGNYTKVITEAQTIVTLQKLSSHLKDLGPFGFIQTHKSYVVATDHVQHIKDHKIHIGTYQIPIGQTFKHAVMGLWKRE